MAAGEDTPAHQRQEGATATRPSRCEWAPNQTEMGLSMSSKNKLFKGAMAGATGVALLAGGFGSFALWSDQQALPSHNISTGSLGILAGEETYTDESPSSATTTWDPTTDKMVPGDIVRVAIPLDVTAEGKNLKGSLDFADASLDLDSFNGMLTVNYDIQLVNDLTSGLAEAGVTYTSSDAPVTFVEGDGSFSVIGVVTFTLSDQATLAQTENANAALNTAAFAVSQDARTTTP